MELPILMKLADEFKSQGVVLYTVNGGEEPELIRRFQQEMEWKFNVVLDQDFKLADAYGVRTIPQLMVIDRGGIVREVHVGFDKRLKDDCERRSMGWSGGSDDSFLSHCCLSGRWNWFGSDGRNDPGFEEGGTTERCISIATGIIRLGNDALGAHGASCS